MHRLLTATEDLATDSPVLAPEAERHLKVLRPRDGEELELFDGCGSFRRFRVLIDGRRWRLEPVSPVVSLPPPPSTITLFACVTKGSRWDWTVEKATELGATRIVPVISARTIVRLDPAECEAKRERWRRVAEDAARQSDAKFVPEVLAPVSFADSLPLVRETCCFVGALAVPPPEPIGDALAARLGSGVGDYAVYVGPEGDFAPDELAALTAIAVPVSFGTTVLRAETAAIFALAALKTFLDRARGASPA